MYNDGQILEKKDFIPSSAAPIYTVTTELPERSQSEDMIEEVGLAIYSNLPCVRDPLDAFDQMVELARSLENRFPMVLVDEMRRPVSTRDTSIIRKQIAEFVDDMHYCGIDPGGQTAVRLFGEAAGLPTDIEIPKSFLMNPNAA